MRLILSVFVISGLLLFSLYGSTEQAILKPGSLVCNSYQDLIMAKEMVANDPQFASNALHRTGLCGLSDPYQEAYIILSERKNQGYQIQFLNSPTRYWVLNENIKSRNTVETKRLIIFPASGQSANELLADKAECKTIAMGKSGFNPDTYTKETSATIVPPPIYNSGGSGVNAVSGAATGAVVGAIAGDAGKGAAIGAVTGAIFGGVERAQRQEEEAEWQRQYQSMQNYQIQEQNNYRAQSKEQYDFVLKSCLENRGYTVK
jgi:Glycine zipper